MLQINYFHIEHAMIYERNTLKTSICMPDDIPQNPDKMKFKLRKKRRAARFSLCKQKRRWYDQVPIIINT